MGGLTVYPIADLRIRVNVQAGLRKALKLSGSELEVNVDQGEVWLRGLVWETAVVEQALAAAAAVEGVKLVHWRPSSPYSGQGRSDEIELQG